MSSGVLERLCDPHRGHLEHRRHLAVAVEPEQLRKLTCTCGRRRIEQARIRRPVDLRGRNARHPETIEPLRPFSVSHRARTKRASVSVECRRTFSCSRDGVGSCRCGRDMGGRAVGTMVGSYLGSGQPTFLRRGEKTSRSVALVGRGDHRPVTPPLPIEISPPTRVRSKALQGPRRACADRTPPTGGWLPPRWWTPVLVCAMSPSRTGLVRGG